MSSFDAVPGSKGNPIPIDSPEQARANLSYIIHPTLDAGPPFRPVKPVKKQEAAHGEAV